MAYCLRDITLARHPTTLVDMTTGDVRHTSLHKHHARRHELQKQELEATWQGKQETVYSNK